MLSNPRLANLLDETIGTGWRNDLTQLSALATLADDDALQQAWRAIRHHNKAALAGRISNLVGIDVAPEVKPGTTNACGHACRFSIAPTPGSFHQIALLANIASRFGKYPACSDAFQSSFTDSTPVTTGC
ncbi:glycogen/starch/alpha-glucan phosphorylase (plasmid) [Pantoea sp. App145]